MLNLGVEIDLDREDDIYINVNVYKLIIEDIHKKSKLADEFRVIFQFENNIYRWFSRAKFQIYQFNT
jgi:hypothetical protein